MRIGTPDISGCDAHTGSSISILYILIGEYDKNNACMKKIVVDIFSVHPEISFYNKKSEKNNSHFIS